MLLVPRQLQRAGMTGTVPYYGGWFTPAQAYAVSQPQSGPPGPASAPPRSHADTQEALRQLRDSGVITSAEYDELRSRVRA